MQLRARPQKGKSVPRILVADDNTNIQKMVSLAFEERGIDVVSVGNGEAAVRRIPDLNPDLVLADVFMPVRNGYEVCEFVKKDDRFSHVPVILLVGAFDPLDEKEARRVGADGVLKKPFVPPDPLIAMVTSALEKNPKVAAEMAKAREVAAAPPAPEPVAPVLEAPARIEPKPLPQYPEPTAEEAAQIYGFGKGVRSTDDEETPADERQAPKSLKAPKASSKKRQDEEDEDDEDSMTAHDWRRSAADFEVPDEPGGSLAFTPDEEFNPITFPSEREVPPRRVPAPDRTSDFDESPTQAHVPARQEAAQASALVEAEPVSSEQPKILELAETEAITLPEPSLSALLVKKPEPEPVVATPTQVQAPAAESYPAETAAPVSTETESHPTHAPKSKIGAWMDMMTSPSEYSEGGWLSGIFGHRSDSKTAHKQNQEDSAEKPTEPQFPKPAADSPIPENSNSHRATEQSSVDAFTVPEPIRADDSFVSNEPRSEDVQPQATLPDSPGPDAPEPESWFAPPPPPVLHDASESRPLLAPIIGSKTDSEFIAPPPDVTGSTRDPEFEEPSSAARVVPEPLWVHDDAEPSEPSRFSRTAEEPAALHSFFAPSSGDPTTEESAAQPDPAHHEEFNTSIFLAPTTESPSADAGDRIPTAPPPNREALADIPFLMPPPPSPFESASENRANDPAHVDAVVAKVLEKLEPQLHQLLSQSLLKPLVENLLQQELEKKEK